MTEFSVNSLFTGRLILRTVSVRDLPQIHELLSRPETDRYNTAGIPADETASQVLIDSWLDGYTKLELYPYVIALKETHAFIGLISLRPGKKNYRRAEVSYKIHPDHWNKGYATEALKAVIDFGFNQLNLHRIEAGCAVDNVGSARVLEKAGMTREGRCRQLLPLKTGWSDNFEYAILETDR